MSTNKFDDLKLLGPQWRKHERRKCCDGREERVDMVFGYACATDWPEKWNQNSLFTRF